MVPKSQHLESTFSKKSISLAIFLFLHLMLTTIQLNHDSFFKTDKIHNIVLDRLLAPELYSVNLFRT